MAKKLKFESFKYRFLIAAQNRAYCSEGGSNSRWRDFVNGLLFENKGGEILIVWDRPDPGSVSVDMGDARFYLRGDSEKEVATQRENGLSVTEDPIKLKNSRYFEGVVRKVAMSAGFSTSDADQIGHDERIQNERQFHDAWANSESAEKIDVRASNEVCTTPEMRYITQRLGDLKGKRLLDVGCGLGEASVYFAMLGADVTSSDLSQGMLDATSRLARANGVSVKQHMSSAEDLQLPAEAKFDVIYAGNLLHHVNIEKTIISVKPHLVPEGVFVSWDPLAYNPAINVYRAMATAVRTPDEHPLKWSDITMFRKHFSKVETRYFWLTTLSIFVIMALGQRRNPNKERFWKVIVQEGDRWGWLYRPLEALDRMMLAIIPPLRLLCWNVVIICKTR